MSGILEPLRQAVTAAHEGNAAALGALVILLGLGELGISVPFLIPGVLCAAGYAITRGNATVAGTAGLLAVLLLGREAGAALIYGASRSVGHPLVEWIGRRSGKVQAGHDALARGIPHHARRAVAVGRLTPGLLLPTTIMAGTMRMPYARFACGVALASLVWDGVFLMLGAAAGEGWRSVIHPAASKDPRLPAVLVTAMLIAAILYLRSRIEGARRLRAGVSPEESPRA